MPLIAVSGPHGSGKSTCSRRLAEKLGYKYLSAGQVFRDFAQKKGLSIEAFSREAEKCDDIDKEIDERTKNLALTEENLVVDAQLAGWLLKEKALLLVYITAPLDIRVKRIAMRENKEIASVHKETVVREESEKNRYHKLYNIEIDDTSIYDLIINSEKFDADDCVDIIMATIKIKEKGV